MKLYNFKDQGSKKPSKKESKFNIKKHLPKLLILLIIVILVVVLTFLYNNNSEVKIWMDKNIFRKEVTNENINIIEIDSDSAPYIYAFDRYIVTLEKNNLKTYNSSGKKELDLDVSVSKPIFSSNNRFLVVAESYGKKVYLISSQGVLWEQNIEGEISRVNVNKNGYVSLAITRVKP